jgi:hypothetical protein
MDTAAAAEYWGVPEQSALRRLPHYLLLCL